MVPDGSRPGPSLDDCVGATGRNDSADEELVVREAADRDLTAGVRSEQFLDRIVENIPDMIFVKDARDLRFVRVNRAGELLMGARVTNS